VWRPPQRGQPTGPVGPRPPVGTSSVAPQYPVSSVFKLRTWCHPPQRGQPTGPVGSRPPVDKRNQRTFPHATTHASLGCPVRPGLDLGFLIFGFRSLGDPTEHVPTGGRDPTGPPGWPRCGGRPGLLHGRRIRGWWFASSLWITGRLDVVERVWSHLDWVGPRRMVLLNLELGTWNLVLRIGLTRVLVAIIMG